MSAKRLRFSDDIVWAPRARPSTDSYVSEHIAAYESDDEAVRQVVRENIARYLTSFARLHRGRAFLRKIIDNDVELRILLSVQVATDCLRERLPDVALLIEWRRSESVPLPLALATERLYVKAPCDVHPDTERRLTIDLYSAGARLYRAHSHELMDERSYTPWVAPPLRFPLTQMPWEGSADVFLQRLQWLLPEWKAVLQCVRRATSNPLSCGIMISGGVMPLCAMRHPVRTETRDLFLRYARETYRKLTVDIFVYKGTLNAARLGLAQRRDPCTWSDEWGRRGVTYYVEVGEFDVQLVNMPSSVSALEIAVRHHLPFVRAWFDGRAVKVTPSCLSSWITRFTNDEPLFGAKVSTERRARFVLKYAMRGFGFGPKAAGTLPFPRTFVEWFREWGMLPLPWHHPFYNPLLWSRVMTEDVADVLLRCVEK